MMVTRILIALMVFIDAELYSATPPHELRLLVDRIIEACGEDVDQGLLSFLCHICTASAHARDRPELIPVTDLRAQFGRCTGLVMSGPSWTALPPTEISAALMRMGHATSEGEVREVIAQTSVWPGVGLYYMNLWLQERAQRSFFRLNDDALVTKRKKRDFWRSYFKGAQTKASRSG